MIGRPAKLLWNFLWLGLISFDFYFLYPPCEIELDNNCLTNNLGEVWPIYKHWFPRNKKNTILSYQRKLTGIISIMFHIHAFHVSLHFLQKSFSNFPFEQFILVFLNGVCPLCTRGIETYLSRTLCFQELCLGTPWGNLTIQTCSIRNIFHNLQCK